MPNRRLTVAAAGRPHPGEALSGDSWTVDWDGPACRVALIDGLGHGPEAARAASAAINVLSAHPGLPPDDALRRCHLALRDTRGAAISVARIEPDAGRLLYAGVGNIEARLWRAGCSERPIAYRGIVGMTLPTIRTFAYELPADWMLLLHTDGISARFGDADIPEDALGAPADLVRLLLSRWSRPRDDAAALAMCPSPEGDAA